MKEDWNVSIEFVLKEEGGENGELVANDKGGYTKFGISSVHNPGVDFNSLTKDGAIEIYRKKYWDAIKGDELPWPLSIAVFDACVNQGDGAARRMLQIALNVSVDGIFGEETITAAFKSGQNTLRRFMAQRMARYARTIMKDTTQEMFIENWSNRLMKLAQLIFKQQEIA